MRHSLCDHNGINIVLVLLADQLNREIIVTHRNNVYGAHVT